MHAEVPGKNARGACTGTLTLAGEASVACPCESFEGGFPDGSPRAVKLRQLTGFEYGSLKKGFSIPILMAEDPSDLTEDEQEATYEYARRLVQKSATHCRTWDAAAGACRWHSMKVIGSGEVSDDPWTLSIDDLDAADKANIGILTTAVLRHLRGLPDGVEVLPKGARFRGLGSGDGGDVPRPGDGLREDAS